MKTKKRFSVLDLMNKDSKAAAPGQQPKYEQAELRIDEIIANPVNAEIYTTEDIGRLAESIELSGRVLQNLVVRDADADGHYMLISGHRRWLACQQLVAEGKEQYRTVNVLIEREQDARIEELLLIESNAAARDLTEAEKAKQAERTTELCRELKAEQKLTGRVRDIVASMLDMSASQLARYHAILSNTQEPELKRRFEDGSMSTAAAYEAQKLDAEKQAKLAEKTREQKKVTVEDVKQMDEQESNYSQISDKKQAELIEKLQKGTISTCEQCHLGTFCENCCRACPNPCDCAQPCQILALQAPSPTPASGTITDERDLIKQNRKELFDKVFPGVLEKLERAYEFEQDLIGISLDEEKEAEAEEHAMRAAVYRTIKELASIAADEGRIDPYATTAVGEEMRNARRRKEHE